MCCTRACWWRRESFALTWSLFVNHQLILKPGYGWRLRYHPHSEQVCTQCQQLTEALFPVIVSPFALVVPARGKRELDQWRPCCKVPVTGKRHLTHEHYCRRSWIQNLNHMDDIRDKSHYLQIEPQETFMASNDSSATGTLMFRAASTMCNITFRHPV